MGLMRIAIAALLLTAIILPLAAKAENATVALMNLDQKTVVFLEESLHW